MHIVFKSDKILSFIIVVSSCAWGLYWLPLRSIEEAGIVGSWSIVFVNACPLLILVPLLLFNLDRIWQEWLQCLAQAYRGLSPYTLQIQK